MKRMIIGMGATGAAVAAFLDSRGEAYDLFDDRKSASEIGESLGHRRFQLFREAGRVPLASYAECVVSPGVPFDHPLLARAREQRVAVVAEIELASRHARGPIIAITGSNGKSTTVSLIHSLLQAAGRKSTLCGNIGTPFIACLDDDPNRCYVLETSSFQLEHAVAFRPRIGALLNISADHLDRHGSLAAYEQAKLRLFARQRPGDLALAPPDYVERLPGSAKKRAVPGPTAKVVDGALTIGGHFRAPLEALPLLGRHNRLNALYACAVAEALGVSAETAAAAMKSFKALEHRLEPIGELQDRLWINDSKATNGHAALAAADAMERPYVLVMGGCDKGERFAELRFRRPPEAIVAYGQTGDKICEDLASFQPVRVRAFREACLAAHRLAKPKEAVLLAPACASFDQFSSFKDRGDAFKRIFEELSQAS